MIRLRTLIVVVIDDIPKKTRDEFFKFLEDNHCKFWLDVDEINDPDHIQYQCCACERIFYGPAKVKECPHCHSDNYVKGYINDVK